MIRKNNRICMKPRNCDVCKDTIKKGESYLEMVASPYHDDLNNNGWWRLHCCKDCRYND